MTDESTKPPSLLSRLSTTSSVLSLVSSKSHVFAGIVNDILVWDRGSLEITAVLKGHDGSVLALELAEERDWLFSSSGDNT